ncbi:MAG: plant virulence effector HPE1-like domain-containing protein [Lentilitoribacter sp.]
MSKLLILSTFALSLSTSLVLADSSMKLDTIKMDETVKGSLIVFGCPSCKKEVEEEGPVLESGTQMFEMRKVGDDEKLYRVENWLGGSPVAFAHVTPTPEGVALLLGKDPNNIDDNSVASIGVSEPTRLAIYGPAQPSENLVEDLAIATLESDEATPLGPEIEPNLKPSIAAASSMPASDVKIEMEDQSMAMAEESAPAKDLDASSFSLRLN